MTDADRHALLFGPYSPPEFRYGDVVICEVRGEVTLVAMTSSRIPWPLGKRGRAKSHAVFGNLAEAIRRDSAAVCYWW
jgi:nucleotide-binding universal stress UspA family protein